MQHVRNYGDGQPQLVHPGWVDQGGHQQWADQDDHHKVYGFRGAHVGQDTFPRVNKRRDF